MWAHTYTEDKLRFCMRAKSRLVTKGITQVHDVGCPKTTSPTPASAPVKIFVVIPDELGLLFFHLGVS